jgi:DNA-binding response OmpR family regulator
MARIMVVEDEALIAALMEEWLVEMGCTTIGPVGSVDAAMALLDGTRPDGVLLDVSLGKESSYPVADKLTAMGVPFAFSTGRSDNEILPRYQGSLTLAKPFDFDALGRVVTTLATRRGSA